MAIPVIQRLFVKANKQEEIGDLVTRENPAGNKYRHHFKKISEERAKEMPGAEILTVTTYSQVHIEGLRALLVKKCLLYSEKVAA